jgi:murein L,D-transpeptidase YcbB/YkuD
MLTSFDLKFPAKGQWFFLGIFCCLFIFCGCRNSKKPAEKDVVKTTKQLKERISENLEELLNYAEENKALVSDSVRLSELKLVRSVYERNQFQPIWSLDDNWRRISDSLYFVISNSKEYGLFPSDYHISPLRTIRNILNVDSASRKDAALWTRADLLMTDAYLSMAKHLKLGRLKADSVSFKKDSLINDDFFVQQFSRAASNQNIITSLQSLEPKYPGYLHIREGLADFLSTANFKKYTYLKYPFKDSLAFIRLLQQRFSEDSLLQSNTPLLDSVSLSKVVSDYQKLRNFRSTGKITESLVRNLNNTDWEKFKSIAVSLDHYKMLPEAVPVNYVLVNLPSYTLYVYDSDTLVFQSKVIVGSPKTKTPLLNSKITNFITYPQWTVPYSIVFRDMLPQIQKDIGYLQRQNLMVVDRYDSVLNPMTIDWSKLSEKKFPYIIRQKEGDDNSLGVIKFNFANKYSVYLHDTNARWLFSKSARALSHGCVRVQDWQELTRYLTSPDTLAFPPDSINAWIVRQEKHTVTGFPKLPLFIRYFTVEGKEGKLKFYNDIYGYDRLSREKYFARKPIS